MYTSRVRSYDSVTHDQGACPFDITELLLAYGWTGRMTGWGQWRRTRCPFWHEDRHPSASVNTTINAFKCWSCGMKGDTVTLLMRAENLTREEALERLQGSDELVEPEVRLPWR